MDGYFQTEGVSILWSNTFPLCAVWIACYIHVYVPFLLQDGMMIVYDVSKASTNSTFLHYMDKMKGVKQASWRELNAKPHTLWANYADLGNMMWKHFSSNMSESVDNMIGPEVYHDYNRWSMKASIMIGVQRW